MKTNEQIKQELVKYLTKTSFHTFVYENGDLFKVVKVEDKFYIINQGSLQKVKEIDIDRHMNYYNIVTPGGYHCNNSKFMLKRMLFGDKILKSVRSNRYTKESIDNTIGTLVPGYTPVKKEVLV